MEPSSIAVSAPNRDLFFKEAIGVCNWSLRRHDEAKS
jgi:hypothetical protein